MRKLYNEFFYIPKHGKIREKVMLTRAAMIVAVVVVCLAAMSITAYAYFSYSITSGTNIIKAASFETNISIRVIDENGEAVKVITSDYQSHTAELKANSEYFITLKHTDRSTAKTGFVIITAEKCDNRYHTQQLGKDGDGNTESITFKIKPNANTKVTLHSHWGTSSYYDDFKNKGNDEALYITQGEVIELSINASVSEMPLADNAAPPTDGTGSTEDTASTTPTTPPAAESTTPSAENEVIHIVAAGENLTQIAEKYNTTLSCLVRYNEISDPNIILPGQEIKIPPADTADSMGTAATEENQPAGETTGAPTSEGKE